MSEQTSATDSTGQSVTRYAVTTTIRGAETATVQWYYGPSLAQAMSAMTTAAADSAREDQSDVPESVRYRTLDVRLRIEHAEATLPESTCVHCGRTIVRMKGSWIDLEAKGDDGIWRTTCDSHDSFPFGHMPTTG